MQKMISADRLARPDNFVLMRARRMREIREEQGLDDRVLPFDEEALRVRLHGIFAGELQAMEAAGRTLFDFPDAPWEFQLDMARQVWDESRHSEIFMRLLQYMGAEPGDYPETEILWRCTHSDDPAARWPESTAALRDSPATSSTSSSGLRRKTATRLSSARSTTCSPTR
jgi:uncharacterized ferritin-like protein (DUF455 family)